MKKISNIFLIIASVLVLSWFMPWLLDFIIPSAAKNPVAYFSPVDNRFIMTETDDDGKPQYRELDINGASLGTITRNDRDRLLPQVFYTVLSGKDELPDSVCGQPVSIHRFKENSWVFVSNPREVNKVQAQVNMMMESMPERLELEDATEVFRFTSDGVEFVDMATNSVLPERSARFTKMLKAEGFTFPAIALNANVTSRKPYDEGYLMVDANHKLFHVKMQVGRPYVHRVEGAERVSVKHVFVMENADHRFLGVFTDVDNNAYMLEASTYAVKKLPFKWNPESERIVIMANLFNWVATVGNSSGVSYVAVDNGNLSLLGQFRLNSATSKIQKVKDCIFPFTLSFTSLDDQYVYPRMQLSGSWFVLLINIALAGIAFCLMRRRRGMQLAWSVATLLLGVYVFIPLIVFYKSK